MVWMATARLVRGLMRKKFKNWWKNNWVAVLYIAFYVICGLLVIGSLAMSITACAMYGDKPVTEIPAWALLFMFGKGGK